MRTVFACIGAVGLLVLAGPLKQSSAPRPLVVAAPLWLNLPDHGQLASVAYTGSFGYEMASGTVIYELGAEPARQLSAMKARLAANGFIIEEQLTSVDSFMDASSMALAYQPASGRVLNMVQFDTPEGALLRVSFKEPPPPVVANVQ